MKKSFAVERSASRGTYSEMCALTPAASWPTYQRLLIELLNGHRMEPGEKPLLKKFWNKTQFLGWSRPLTDKEKKEYKHAQRVLKGMLKKDLSFNEFFLQLNEKSSLKPCTEKEICTIVEEPTEASKTQALEASPASSQESITVSPLKNQSGNGLDAYLLKNVKKQLDLTQKQNAELVTEIAQVK